MELNDFATQVLYGKSLEEKLLVSPKIVTDNYVNKTFVMPKAPGRPKELEISSKGVRVEFPRMNRLDEDEPRGQVLHFLANHELLATELMALVLLKFPNAPSEFRMGVFETLKEEQAHTLMYIRRMKSCGITFGELPVNDYFWKAVAPMEKPMDFVSRLSLVFEQANLDYSVYYSKLFQQVGDGATAKVLDKIYEDEIEHVGHGLRWFRKWKKKGDTDWEAFGKQLHFPLSLIKSKGVAPYNAEGRRLAGIGEEWIEELEVVGQSRGRTPIFHWFNPNVEGEEAARVLNRNYEPRYKMKCFEEDLRILPLSWSRLDDVVLVDELPSREHLKNLKTWGFVLPEFLLKNAHGFEERKVGGVRPWAWQQKASDLFESLKDNISEKADWKWHGGLDSIYFSKKLGYDFNKKYSPEIPSVWCTTLKEVEQSVDEFSKRGGDVCLKSPYGNAGQSNRRLIKGEYTESLKGWIINLLDQGNGILVEPWEQRVLDFSVQYERGVEGKIRSLGVVRVLNDVSGRFQGILALPKWTQGLPKELTRFLFHEKQAHHLYNERMVVNLEEFFKDSDFSGGFGIDAMIYKDTEGQLQIRSVVEMNMRMTMGRVAIELLNKTKSGLAGCLMVRRKTEVEKTHYGVSNDEDLKRLQQTKGLGKGLYALNDPQTAKEFVVEWRVDTPREVMID